MNCAVLIALCTLAGTVTRVKCDEDAGFLASELASTAHRLSSLHATSDLAIPTQAYANAFADMRPSQPTFSFGPNDGSPIKLALPSFALKQTNSGSDKHARLQADALKQEEPVGKARTSELSSGSVDAVMNALLGGGGRTSSSRHEQGVAGIKLGIPPRVSLSAKQDRGGGAAGKVTGLAEKGTTITSSDALASVDPNSARALALARLERKHAGLIGGMKEREEESNPGPSDDSDNEALSASGRGEGGGAHAKLDNKIKKYHGWLAKAVMGLAGLAGTAILGGIGAVLYCWLKREKGTGGPDPPSKEERFNGKNYGRPTAQYGSYGAAMKGRR